MKLRNNANATWIHYFFFPYLWLAAYNTREKWDGIKNVELLILVETISGCARVSQRRDKADSWRSTLELTDFDQNWPTQKPPKRHSNVPRVPIPPFPAPTFPSPKSRLHSPVYITQNPALRSYQESPIPLFISHKSHNFNFTLHIKIHNPHAHTEKWKI